MSSTSTISAATSPAPEQTSPRSSWNARQFPSVSGRVKRTAISVKEFAITSHSFGILMPVDHDDPISRDFSDFPGALLVPRFNGPTRQNLFYQHTIFPFKYLNCELTGPASAKRSIENVAAGLENPAASAVGEGSVSDPVPPEPAKGPWLHVLLFTALSASFSNSKHFQHLSTSFNSSSFQHPFHLSHLTRSRVNQELVVNNARCEQAGSGTGRQVGLDTLCTYLLNFEILPR